MAAQRLHLPVPLAVEHVTHVFHTADPIAMGTCNGVLSSCAIGGYAMESRYALFFTLQLSPHTLTFSCDAGATRAT